MRKKTNKLGERNRRLNIATLLVAVIGIFALDGFNARMAGAGFNFPFFNDKPPAATTSPSFKTNDIEKLAVMINRNGGKNIANDSERSIEDEFVSAFLVKGYAMTSRSDVEAILQEGKFQNAGLTDKDVVKLGKLLNVPAVLLVTVTDYKVTQSQSTSKVYTIGSKNSSMQTVTTYDALVGMSARLVSVEKAEILWTVKESRHYSSSGSSPDETDLLAQESKRLAKAFPDRNSPSTSLEKK